MLVSVWEYPPLPPILFCLSKWLRVKTVGYVELESYQLTLKMPLVS